MQSHEFDIAIIGGGCIGSSIVYELSQRGINNVVLVDSGRKTLSATSHSGGMLRVFHESTDHTDLALNNFAILKQYQQANVLDPVKQNGSLYFFNKKRYQGYKKNFAQMQQSGYPFEILNSSAGKSRFPQYLWNDEWAIYEPHGSQFSPKKFMDALIMASARHGATIVDNFEITRIHFCRNRYQLIGADNLVVARTVVLAGGARLLPKLIDLGLMLPLEVKQIRAYIAKKIIPDSALPNYFDRESMHFGCFTHKDKVVLSNINDERMKERQWGDIIKELSAYDIYAPDRNGLLGIIPGFSNLFIATGWGGTAFKFALEIARRTANTIEISTKRRIP